MTYLVAGAGFLGAYLLRYLSAHTEAPILAAVRDLSDTLPLPGVRYVAFDVTDPDSLRRLAAACGGEALTVFYFAACHNVDYLFEHPDEAKKVNLEGLSLFLETVGHIEKLFFASTDCVYGENPPDVPKLKETDPCVPVNEYGRQKLAAEKIVRARGFTAVRFPYMMGPSLLKKRHFYDRLAALLAAGQPVEMLDGMVRSALSYETAARLLARLSDLPADRLPPAVNLCGDAALSKYELGLIIAKACGAPESLVLPLPEAEGQRFFKDRRASRTVMDNDLLKRLLGLSEVGFGGWSFAE